MNFQTKCIILGQFWFEFRDDDKLKDFIEYNDIGLPLAWFISVDVVKPQPIAEDYIDETFSLFLSSFDLSEEEAEQFQTLNDLLSYVEMRNDI